MDNNQLAEAAKILGVSEDSISAMDDEIKKSMTAVFETISVRNDEDKKAVFEALDNLWQKGSVYIGLDEVAKSTGILLVTLRSLDYDYSRSLTSSSALTASLRKLRAAHGNWLSLTVIRSVNCFTAANLSAVSITVAIKWRSSRTVSCPHS